MIYNKLIPTNNKKSAGKRNFKSVFSIPPLTIHDDTGIQPYWSTTKFINGIRCSRIRNHQLVLKKKVLLMLMRNFDIFVGLCNRKGLVVEELRTVNHIGTKVYIQRMDIYSIIQL